MTTCVCDEIDPSDRPCLVCDVTALDSLRARVIEAAQAETRAERVWLAVAPRRKRGWPECLSQLRDARTVRRSAVDALDATEALELGSPRLCPGCRAFDGEHDFGQTCTLAEARDRRGG